MPYVRLSHASRFYFTSKWACVSVCMTANFNYFTVLLHLNLKIWHGQLILNSFQWSFALNHKLSKDLSHVWTEFHEKYLLDCILHCCLINNCCVYNQSLFWSQQRGKDTLWSERTVSVCINVFAYVWLVRNYTRWNIVN